jgi:hypothetical protein
MKKDIQKPEEKTGLFNKENKSKGKSVKKSARAKGTAKYVVRKGNR